MTPVQKIRFGPHLAAQMMLRFNLYNGLLQCCADGISCRNQTHVAMLRDLTSARKQRDSAADREMVV